MFNNIKVSKLQRHLEQTCRVDTDEDLNNVPVHALSAV